MTVVADRDGALRVEGASLGDIAQRYGTPCFVYSRAALEAAFREFDAAFAAVPHLVCYALKANSNLAVLDVFARLGSGFDVVSGGELARAIAAGGAPDKIVFSGVGKTEDELRQGLQLGILCFNVESASELDHLDRLAGKLGKKAPISLRVNPDVDPRTHPHISTGLKESKFGVDFEEALPLYLHAAKMANIRLCGIDMHIGSQITALEPYREAAAKLLRLVDKLAEAGIHLQHVDFGGGLGIRYQNETPPSVADYAETIVALVHGRRESIILEPGRSLTGNAGLLLTRVIYLKPGPQRNFAIVDAAMNDLIRPALYDAWHDVRPVRPRGEPTRSWQIVGPVCESADFLALDRELALSEGDLLALLSAGAYSMSMSSNYNSRPRAAEVVVDGETTHLVRSRETIAGLFECESRLPPAR
ncbi:MAG TPA: diaminopimelate decarboxylase [Casimicrobiaceae bacterium]|nr:diaminopimelate decarboxylase [Casimicrobiaceae bacterium]